MMHKHKSCIIIVYLFSLQMLFSFFCFFFFILNHERLEVLLMMTPIVYYYIYIQKSTCPPQRIPPFLALLTYLPSPLMIFTCHGRIKKNQTTEKHNKDREKKKKAGPIDVFTPCYSFFFWGLSFSSPFQFLHVCMYVYEMRVSRILTFSS